MISHRVINNQYKPVPQDMGEVKVLTEHLQTQLPPVVEATETIAQLVERPTLLKFVVP